ncbi:hypothetical protein RKD48_004252 [Streptomyces ambofaciens]
MSLRLLLPAEGVAGLLSAWSDQPRVYDRGLTEVDEAPEPGPLQRTGRHRLCAS